MPIPPDIQVPQAELATEQQTKRRLNKELEVGDLSFTSRKLKSIEWDPSIPGWKVERDIVPAL